MKDGLKTNLETLNKILPDDVSIELAFETTNNATLINQ